MEWQKSLKETQNPLIRTYTMERQDSLHKVQKKSVITLTRHVGLGFVLIYIKTVILHYKKKMNEKSVKFRLHRVKILKRLSLKKIVNACQ